MTVIFQYFTENCIFIATLLYGKINCSIQNHIYVFRLFIERNKKHYYYIPIIYKKKSIFFSTIFLSTICTILLHDVVFFFGHPIINYVRL